MNDRIDGPAAVRVSPQWVDVGRALHRRRALVSAAALAVVIASVPAIAAVTRAMPKSTSPVRMSADGRYVVYARAIADPYGPLPVGIDLLDRLTGVVSEVAAARVGPAGYTDPGAPGDANAYKGLAISANGRVVAFASGRPLVTPDDNGGIWDIYVRDLDSGILSRVSVSSTGVQGNGHSAFPSLSADGRYVAFSSAASNLVANDTNGKLDVFVHDRGTGTTERVNVSSTGAQTAGDVSTINAPFPQAFWCHCPSISASGREVAFWSFASDVVPGDTNANLDAFVHDRQTGATTRVSVKSDGSQSFPWAGPAHLGISGDGRYVAFEARTNDLDPRKTTPNTVQGMFIHDRFTGMTELVSLNSAGESANGLASGDPHLSYDGRFVTFLSEADNLVPNDTNGQEDAFLRDRLLGTTVLVNASSTGLQGNGTLEGLFQISDDGRFVSFQDNAQLDPDVFGNAYVRDFTCANGTVEGTEACDDGNLIDTDACDLDCRVTECPASVCGDGVVSGCETCDDGNAVGGDCCSAWCTYQGRGSACQNEGNPCTLDVCDGEGGCDHLSLPNNVPCNDGLFCNGADRCVGGSCVPISPSADPCSSGTECNRTCNEATDDCFDPDGSLCTDDGNPCTSDTCDGLGGCAHQAVDDGLPCDDADACTTGDACVGGACVGGATRCPLCQRCVSPGGCIVAPRSGCKRVALPRKALLTLRNRTPDTLDRLTWKWTRGQTTDASELGDPPGGDDYAFCLYDQNEALRLMAAAPGGTACGSPPCWTALGGDAAPSGYRYAGGSTAPDGIDGLVLHAGAVGAAKAVVKGSGDALAMPALETLALPLRAQLQADNGLCLEAEFTFAGLRLQTATKLAAKGE